MNFLGLYLFIVEYTNKFVGQDWKRRMKRILEYLKPYVLKMSEGFLIKFAGTIMDLCLPWILAYIIDNVVPTKNRNMVYFWGLIMLICAFLAVGFNIWANCMASRVARDTTRRIRHDLFEKITFFSSREVDTVSVPSLVSRMTSDTYNIHQIVGMMQKLGVRAPILLIGGIAITMTLDPVLSLVLIITLPFLTYVVYIVSKKGIPLYRKQQEATDRMIGKVRENITGVRVIKALSKTDYETEEFEKINNEVVDKETKAGMVMALTNPTMNFVLNIGWVLIILVGAYRVNEGLTQVGKIVAFLTYFTIILNALLSVTRLFVLYSKAVASAARIDEVLSMENDIRDFQDKFQEIYPDKATKESNDIKETEAIKEASEYNPENMPYIIEFNKVTFSYNKKKPNIKNISFQIKKGESLGIIGTTGSGKSTIINLLMRFYDTDEGEIKINGVNIKNIDQGSLHKMFGVVFQNDTIFEDTIFENISLGRKISLSQAEEAADYAKIKEHIMKMELGYESKVAIRGANLSGGQKQRLLIARALANHPEILILDDSSSALDYKTDAQVRNEIKNHFTEATVVVIAQRVSAVMSLDHILLLENGEILGYGTHDELMKTSSIYREISESQMGGDMDEQ